MSLSRYLKQGKLRRHRTSKQEINELLAIVERDLKTAAEDIDNDWRFGIAYNAGLKLCTILLYARGYRAHQGSHHMISIDCLTLILPSRTKKDTSYLDACRRKRNLVEYDCTGAASSEDADKLIDYVKKLRADVTQWLKKSHPQLL